MGCNENGISWTWNLYRNKVVIKMDHDTTTTVAGMIAAGAATSRVFAYVSGASGVGAVPAVVAGAGGILLAYYAGDMLLHDDGCGIELKYHIYNGIPAPFYDIDGQ